MTEQSSQTPSRLAMIISKLLPAIFVLAVVAGGWFAITQFTADGSTNNDTQAEADIPATESEIVLPKAKITKAGFTTESASIQKITNTRTVSGRVTYNEARHIEVKAPVSGVLVDVLVKPGDSVSDGQLLAIMNSPDIGRARAAVLNEQAKFDVILKQVERLRDVTGNLRSLFERLDKNTPLDDIQREFNDKSLGIYRAEIMEAYSERFLANQLAAAARPLTESGTMPLRTLRERDNNRHVADAKFRSARENTAYDTSIRMQQLDADRDDAHRQVMIAENHLATLLGFPETAAAAATSESLSRMEVRASFSGTIESRTYAKQERVQQSDSLFVLANTDSLYISADIRENEWAAMSVKPGQEIGVIAPAIPDRKFVATVHYVGREVAIESNSLPLVATIENSDGLLRPGMFVRVTIPVSQSGDVVAVPSGSVLQHENEQFVFVAVNDDTFRRVNVQTGVSNEEWVEIAAGLEAGQPVVAGGAFLLKSELLLAGEE